MDRGVETRKWPPTLVGYKTEGSRFSRRCRTRPGPNASDARYDAMHKDVGQLRKPHSAPCQPDRDILGAIRTYTAVTMFWSTTWLLLLLLLSMYRLHAS
jgi:hypothetical protein